MRIALWTFGFIGLLFAFWLTAVHFGVTSKLGEHAPSGAISFAILLAPYCAFGFGFADWLRDRLGGIARVVAPLALMVSYLIFTLPRGDFRWDMCLGLASTVLAVTILLEYTRADWLVLALLGISVDLHFFDKAWPVQGLTGTPKLLLVDAGLYGFLVIRDLKGVGYDFRVRVSDILIGLREFAFYTPIALLLGFALSFLHFHRTPLNPVEFSAGWLFTVFFVAIPEELFFRGLLLNLMERRTGTARALAVTSVLFGLAHFNKRAQYFNWRYVILATVAGIFYGRAWLARGRLPAAAITHATVDTVWALWLR